MLSHWPFFPVFEGRCRTLLPALAGHISPAFPAFTGTIFSTVFSPAQASSGAGLSAHRVFQRWVVLYGSFFKPAFLSSLWKPAIMSHVGKVIRTSCVQRRAARNNVISQSLVILCVAQRVLELCAGTVSTSGEFWRTAESGLWPPHLPPSPACGEDFSVSACLPVFRPPPAFVLVWFVL